jgi:hypothetical protein
MEEKLLKLASNVELYQYDRPIGPGQGAEDYLSYQLMKQKQEEDRKKARKEGRGVAIATGAGLGALASLIARKPLGLDALPNKMQAGLILGGAGEGAIAAGIPYAVGRTSEERKYKKLEKKGADIEGTYTPVNYELTPEQYEALQKEQERLVKKVSRANISGAVGAGAATAAGLAALIAGKNLKTKTPKELGKYFATSAGAGAAAGLAGNIGGLAAATSTAKKELDKKAELFNAGVNYALKQAELTPAEERKLQQMQAEYYQTMSDLERRYYNRYQEEKRNVEKKQMAKNLGAGALTGAAVGSTVGLIATPKPNKMSGTAKGAIGGAAVGTLGRYVGEKVKKGKEQKVIDEIAYTKALQGGNPYSPEYDLALMRYTKNASDNTEDILKKRANFFKGAYKNLSQFMNQVKKDILSTSDGSIKKNKINVEEPKSIRQTNKKITEDQVKTQPQAGM